MGRCLRLIVRAKLCEPNKLYRRRSLLGKKTMQRERHADRPLVGTFRKWRLPRVTAALWLESGLWPTRFCLRQIQDRVADTITGWSRPWIRERSRSLRRPKSLRSPSRSSVVSHLDINRSAHFCIQTHNEITVVKPREIAAQASQLTSV